MRIFAVSDLRTDFAENRRRLRPISSTSYLRDALVVAGDIADDLRLIDWTLRKLRPQFSISRAIILQTFAGDLPRLRMQN